MANHVLQKLGSMFTAAILCASCLPFGSVSAAGNNTADADISETIPNLVKSPEQLVQDAERGDFLTLSYATLLGCAYFGAGYASTFSEKNQTLLDVDHSGRIDSTDIFLLMYWCAYQGATGDYTEDSITFLSEWDTANGSVTTETTPLETTVFTTEETTTTAAPATTVSSDSTAVTTADTTVTTAAPTTETTTTTTTTATTTTTTTTTTAATTTTTTTTTTNRGGAWAQKDSYRGVDVSKYQTNIDWKAVKADGIDFAMIRAGYGKVANQKDPYFEQNMKNAKAAGIACGTYWYSYATTPAEARQEAELFASVIQGYQFEYPVVLDIEDKVQTALTKEQVSAVINAFCEVMESKGYYVSLYSYASFLNTYVYQSVLEDYDIWVAHFNVSRPSYSKTSYGMWQYSNSGNINGINGNVDLDYSYKCYPDLMTKYHLNGF